VKQHTIASIHAGLRDGTLTATALVRHHLARIAAYDRAGPGLRALLTVNPRAIEEAERLDAQWRAGQRGLLHGVPVIL